MSDKPDPNRSFDKVLDKYYPRDENGRHYLPAPKPIDFGNLRKFTPYVPGRSWITPIIGGLK